MKKILIIAGPNGAGKTTFANEFLPKEAGCPEFVNADLIAAGLSPFQPEQVAFAAGRLMLARIDELVGSGKSFAFETTLSTRSWLRLIPRWKSLGYRVKLYFLSLPDPDFALLLVEGEDDRRSLGAIFKEFSTPIERALVDGSFAIETLNGGSNLCYKLSEARAALCNAHVFLDRDACGMDAAKRAEDEGLLGPADIHYAICSGQSETEFEDLLSKNLYGPMLLNKYGVSIAHPKFKGKRKWSDRLKLTFEAQGKLWTDSIQEEVKYRVAALVEANPSKAIEPNFQAIIDSLSQAIQEKLVLITNSRDNP